MTYDKPITVQVQDATTEEWADVLQLHARVNKAASGYTSGGHTTMQAGADQYRIILTFELRYIRALEDIAYGPQPYRILYRGNKFKVTGYDDYMEQHRTVKLTGEFYG